MQLHAGLQESPLKHVILLFFECLCKSVNVDIRTVNVHECVSHRK